LDPPEVMRKLQSLPRESELKANGNHQAASRRPSRGGSWCGIARASQLAFLLLLLPSFSSFAAAKLTAAQGDAVSNIATVNADGFDPQTSAAATIKVRIPSPPKIELMVYAPLSSAAQQELVAPGAYLAGSAAGPMTNLPLPAPIPTGLINLSATVPLVGTQMYHQGDPIFIRVTELDENMDRTAREQVRVTITADLTGDIEVVRLVEDGPDTGVFMGYIPTRRTAKGVSTNYDGVLQLVEKTTVTARYVNLNDSFAAVSAAAGVDPFSVVFDSKSGQPVNGAQITVVDVATGQPAAVMSDDGAANFPATIISGTSTTDSGGRVYPFGPGEFRFPVLPVGRYRYDVKAPSGYSAPSKATDAQLAAVGSFTIVTGSRDETFQLNPAPAMHIDIPIDPSGVALWVTKTASKDSVGIGDFLAYQISVLDADKVNGAGNVHAMDAMPTGFRYKKGSTQINGVPSADPATSADGRMLDFAVGDLAAGASSTITFVAQVGASAVKNQLATNTATATDAGKGTSNLAQASVKVTDDFFSSKSFLMGRVTTGVCNEQDGQGELAVEGVRILLEDGTYAGTDKQGQYHFEGVTPGTHVVQMDLDTLPEGYEAVSCVRNDRFAGRAFSQFVDIQGGTLWRADFHLRAVPKPPAPPPPPPPPPPSPGELGISLNHTVDNLSVRFAAAVRGARASMPDAKLTIQLPAALQLEQGSSDIDGIPVADPTVSGTTLVYDLGAVPQYWLKVVTFHANVSEEGAAADLPVTATLSGTEGGETVTSKDAANVLKMSRESLTKPVSLVIRPHFPSFGTELSAPDKKQLEQLAKRLAKSHPDHVIVTGHTDSQKIRKGAQAIFKDNTALSLGRATSVGKYLAQLLHLPEEKMQFDGKGESEPVATNETVLGRSMNRRVEVTAFAADTEEKATLVSVTDASGEQRQPVLHNAVSAALNAAVKPGAANAVPAVSITPAAAAPGPANFAVSAPQADLPRAGLADSAAAPMAAGGPIPAHSQQIQSSQMPPNDGLAQVAPALQPAAPPKDGILSPADGELVPDRINAIQIRVANYLVIKLAVDGKEVDSSRIGYKGEDPNTSKNTYTFVGVDLGLKGPHEITLTGADPFGNVRLKETAHVLRTGEIASIRFVSAENNVADGKTPVHAKIELLDNQGNVISGATRLELKEGNLSAARVKDAKLSLDDSVGRQIAMDKDGNIFFAPVNTSGSYRAVLSCGGSTVEVETWAKPKMRDWVLVGLAEGTAGYNAVTGNAATLDDQGVDRNLYADGRVAFYAKGQVQGKWLITAAYDSARAPHQSQSLFNQIDPNTYFTLYGDGSQQGYDAASSRKVYVKIEREQFYALFGDFDTGLTVTELTRYTRKLNGFKAELQTKNLEVNAFGAETDQAYARDEIAGDGTSGLYHLSRRSIVLNSETVTILTRDRFRSEVIVASQVMTRFTDYSIDYDGGTIFFREPISSRDENLNPITIVVEYESSLLGQKDVTAGGRVGIKVLDNKIKAGVTYVHEGQGDRQNDLIGADAKIQIDQNTRLRGEYAVTDSREVNTDANVGQAWLAELARTTKKLDAKLYIREEQGAFGLGQQAFSEAGTRKFGGESAFRLDDQFTLSGQAYRQDTFTTGAERLFGEARFGYVNGAYGAYAGLLDASDKLIDGTEHTSGQLTVGGKVTIQEKLTLALDYAQSVWGNGSADFPTRIALRAEYKLMKNLTLIGDEELTFGDNVITNNARLGFRSSLWQGGTLTSTFDRTLDENEARVFGNIGLRQQLQLSQAWKVDAGAERTLTVHRTGFYTVNPLLQPASGATGEDFTAISVGANYQVKKLVWDSRAELRTATLDDKWSLTSGVVAERSDGWAWSGRAQYLGAKQEGSHTTSGDLRFGLVYRPAQTHWILLNRLDWTLQRMSGIDPLMQTPVATTTVGTNPVVSALGNQPLAAVALGIDSWRIVDNFLANFRPTKKLQLSLGYGLKYGREIVQNATYEGFTDQPSVEARYDLNETWDVGVRASVLHVYGLHQLAYSAGPSVGMSPATNVWIGAGVNLIGYYDQDFSASNATATGPYVKMRFKFDQDSVKEAAAWINKQ
jgi:outer membrane protein OmpA-like peptidoglycan-associated protein